MKFVIRKVIAQEWELDNREFDNHKVSHYEDKIYLNSYTYKEALKKICMIYGDIEQQYNRLNTSENVTIEKWNISVMLVPVSEKFKSQTSWINTKNFLKYKVD